MERSTVQSCLAAPFTLNPKLLSGFSDGPDRGWAARWRGQEWVGFSARVPHTTAAKGIAGAVGTNCPAGSVTRSGLAGGGASQEKEKTSARECPRVWRG